MKLLIIEFKDNSVKTQLIEESVNKKQLKEKLLSANDSLSVRKISFKDVDIDTLVFAAKSGPKDLVKTIFEFIKELPMNMDEITEALDMVRDEFQEGDQDEIFRNAIMLAIQQTIYSYLEDSEEVMDEINDIFKSPIYIKQLGMSYDLYGDGSLFIQQFSFKELEKEITDYFLSLYSLQMQQYMETGEYDEDESED